jgi:hypothetical protein
VSDHTCHHPHCDRPVPPKMLACRPHWFALPKPLRDNIWATYRPGQEQTKDPSVAYLEAFMDCQAFWLGQDAA